jgi:hypothetical protein
MFINKIVYHTSKLIKRLTKRVIFVGLNSHIFLSPKQENEIKTKIAKNNLYGGSAK